MKVTHGGLIKQYLERTGKKPIDFSASLNPFTPPIKFDFPPRVLEYYPDDSYTHLREVIGEVFSRDPSEIAVGNGSIEIIRLFCQLIFRKGGGALIDPTTFGEYSLSAELAGGHRATPGEIPAGVFICNPNNPTGTLKKKQDIADLVRMHTSRGSYVLLDEAFIELADPAESLIDIRDPRLLVLRSLTKCFAVPGLRFGYALGDPGFISQLEVMRPPWSVNSFAEQFALQAFEQYPGLAASREKIKTERDWLVRELKGVGFTVTPPDANFILAEVGRDAGDLSRELLDKGFLVRDCTSFGLPRAIRIAVRTHGENTRLMGAIRECLH